MSVLFPESLIKLIQEYNKNNIIYIYGQDVSRLQIFTNKDKAIEYLCLKAEEYIKKTATIYETLLVKKIENKYQISYDLETISGYLLQPYTINIYRLY